MKNTAAASRYAKALLELAVEQNKVDSVAGDMNYFAQAVQGSHDLELLLASPIINSDKKISIFEKVFEQFEELTMAFMRLIIKNRREDILPVIAASFDSQVKDHKGISPVTIVSAKTLDPSTKDLILSKVSGLISGTPEVTEQIDESLIGGFVVKLGDRQLDASVVSQLNNLKQRLTR